MSRRSCKCKKCVGACHTRPCWGTPEDAQKLIDAGYADRLMDDYWVGDGEDGGDIHMLCPAVVGYEGGPAPDTDFMSMLFGTNPFGRCTFLDEHGLCELHDKKLKPLEGRRAWPCGEPRDEAYERHKRCAMSWNNEKGRALVKKWRELMKRRRKKAS